MEYKHAKDYLKDFMKDKEDWLKCLVSEAINTNAEIRQERLDEIYESIINGNKINFEQKAQASEKPKEKLLIKSLNHKSGVNSLAENQIIKFSDNVTVVYGLNGSGKSGYFRILNEICGGNQEKEILQNVYEDKPKDIEVCIEYSLDDEEETLAWDNSVRGINNFNGTHVYDSSYLNGLLSKRETDSYVLYPLGLHLFAYLADIIDAFSNRIQQTIIEKKNNLPDIDTTDFTDELKDNFNNKRTVNSAQKKNIEAKFTFDKDKELIGAENELKDLKQLNIKDKIEIILSNAEEIKNIIDSVKNTQNKIIKYSENLNQLYLEQKS